MGQESFVKPAEGAPSLLEKPRCFSTKRGPNVLLIGHSLWAKAVPSAELSADHGFRVHGFSGLPFMKKQRSVCCRFMVALLGVHLLFLAAASSPVGCLNA